MSRIGKKPVVLPDKVKVSIEDDECIVEGPKGKLSQKIPYPIEVSLDDGKVLVERPSDNKRIRALHGLTRSLISNMVTGVTEGFTKTLRIAGLGYRAQYENGTLTLQLNYSHPIIYKVPEGIDVTIERAETVQNQPEIPVVLSGIDKQLLGQVAANIRDFQPPEPYKGKGIKYLGEHIIRKAGKAAGLL
ncbi:50S ribosomal protein L6 [Candidatus Poribacteria bacterium]|nr:50S ribosomal protein L6 [Candidatus Poribacteria bacterium]